MQYFKSSRFIALLFFTFTLMIGCVAMITATRASAQWRTTQENVTTAGSFKSEDNIFDGENHWIVRAYEDRIGVFKPDGQLEYMIDVYLITLPTADQELLKNGIYIAGKDRLAAFIEDYTG